VVNGAIKHCKGLSWGLRRYQIAVIFDANILKSKITNIMVRYEALRLASMFNIDLFGNCSAVSIKSAIWCSFISRILF